MNHLMEKKYRETHPNILETYFDSIPDYVRASLREFTNDYIGGQLKAQSKICQEEAETGNSIIGAPEPEYK